MNPKIGIVICGFEKNRQFVPSPYIQAIAASGGIPFLIPFTPDPELDISYLSAFEGFLFCGGDDVSPPLYGEELLTTAGSTDWEIDVFHLRLMQMVLDSKLPVLGICRGMQVMNLALGGTIYQDLSLRNNFTLNHVQNSRKRSDVSHLVSLTSNSLLCEFLPESFHVNSFHHQCIKTLGSDLRISATASDGVIEAIEHTEAKFALGVQWHPECMYETSSDMRALFSRFIKNASGVFTLQQC